MPIFQPIALYELLFLPIHWLAFLDLNYTAIPFFQISTYVWFVWKITLDIAFGINLKNSDDDRSSEVQPPSLRRRLHQSFRFTTKRWNYVWLCEAWINTGCLTNSRKESHKNTSKDVLPGCRQLGWWHGKRDRRYAFKNLAANNTGLTKNIMWIPILESLNHEINININDNEKQYFTNFFITSLLIFCSES